MDMKVHIAALWDAVARQDGAAMREFFAPDAVICWHCTDEQFTLEEYIWANCEYPGRWRGEVERVMELGGNAVAAVRVWVAEGSASFHCAAIYQFRDGKIIRSDEYWGDDGPAPQWRQEKNIGKRIEK